MDEATRRLRARNKAMLTPRGQLSNFEARGLGRKLKSAETFPNRQCSHIEGGEKGYVKKQRKNGEWYSAGPFIIGGTRCLKNATVNDRCLKHLKKEDE